MCDIRKNVMLKDRKFPNVTNFFPNVTKSGRNIWWHYEPFQCFIHGPIWHEPYCWIEKFRSLWTHVINENLVKLRFAINRWLLLILFTVLKQLKPLRDSDMILYNLNAPESNSCGIKLPWSLLLIIRPNLTGMVRWETNFEITEGHYRYISLR